ncbi:oxidoreductase [Paenibacillus terrae HPL-003]|uniref:Oxidoreductase n=1 Tax=Paenibacillus terrae (strain HPL-003) TaxID=985665 RepID=G7VP88_PAETH|nr:NAD(P)H-binding protein [Paenibacillus terrae]AET60965.1 oxidoreductase [Paenibacillus terrae HPL-003]
MAKKQGATAVVAGATGLVGQQLVKLLLKHPAYRRVVVLVRRDMGMSHPKLIQKQLSFDRLQEELDGTLLKNADVFCALGTTIRQAGSQGAFRQVDYAYPLALGQAAKQHGAAKFLIVTAMGSSERSTLFYNRVKGEVERDLRHLGLPRVVLLRPSFMLGDREERRLGEKAGIIAFQLLRPFMIGSLSRFKAVHSRDVAQVMIQAARQKAPAWEAINSDEIARRATASRA